MRRVFVTKDIPGIDRLGKYDVGVWRGEGPVPRDLLRSEATHAVGLLTMLTDRVDAVLIESASQLEVISQMAVGVDNIDVATCERAGIALGHTPEVLTETVADSAWALLASVVRRLPEGEREVRAGEWGAWEVFHLAGGDLHDTVIGIVGMGRIGNAVARRARGFDMDVIYASPGTADIDAERVSLEELLERADHVVVCTRLDDSTRGLIGRAELAAMKNSAYLVNISRGPVIETEALVAALEQRQIAGVALDVTDPEPLPPDHPLLTFENCLIVPHIASASVRTRNAMANMAVDNLIAAMEGEEMPARFGGGG